jgi:VIT family
VPEVRLSTPYFLFRTVYGAPIAPAIVTLLDLLFFGYIKKVFTVSRPLRSAWQIVVIGGKTGTDAFALVKAIS